MSQITFAQIVSAINKMTALEKKRLLRLLSDQLAEKGEDRDNMLDQVKVVEPID